jgi:hypothetical protein
VKAFIIVLSKGGRSSIASWQAAMIDVIPEVQEAYDNKLKSKLFGLLCEFEKDRNWEECLDNIMLELMGYTEDQRTINYYILFYKLSTLRYLKYKYFRTTIFDCINLIGK